jgi:2-dehydro-3-deoxy-D-arabinonate dehydratase
MTAPMKLFKTGSGALLERDGSSLTLGEDWDTLINRSDLAGYLRSRLDAATGKSSAERQAESRAPSPEPRFLPPVGTQEVWAAGVTYLRSRTARMEESKTAGGGSFYDKVYDAVRPELFFKASPWRVRGDGDAVRIRGDASWSVPEPELALVVNALGEIVGYTIGNDMSSRDIEGENPLYLPQAKMYDGSCALGPGILIREQALATETEIAIAITRAGAVVFDGRTTVAQMKRTPEELVSFLYREMSFPQGAILLTGTGIIPPDDFTLQSGDEIVITIEAIGRLRNSVE